MSTLIPLTRGLSAIVDDEMVDLIEQYSWNAINCKTAKTWYAVTSVWEGDGQRRIFMHRFIFGGEQNQKVDHINRNGLDNRKDNLRLASHSLNMANRVWTKGAAKTGFRGVYPNGNRFRAQIRVDGTLRNLGTFESEVVAARAYDAAARRAFGEFAVTNFNDVLQRTA